MALYLIEYPFDVFSYLKFLKAQFKAVIAFLRGMLFYVFKSIIFLKFKIFIL